MQQKPSLKNTGMKAVKCAALYSIACFYRHNSSGEKKWLMKVKSMTANEAIIKKMPWLYE